MKYKLLHKIFSVFSVIVFLLPFGIQSIHTIDHKTNDLCNAKEVKHIHKHKKDCSIYHHTINHNLLDFPSEFNLTDFYFHHDVPTNFYQPNYLADITLKSPRAPPFYCF